MDYRSLHAKTVADLRQIGRSLKVKFPVGKMCIRDRRMDWLELTVLTTTEGSELVSQILIDAGASGTVIEDKNDVALNQRPEGQWDIIDEEIARRMGDDVKVKAYYAMDARVKDTLAHIEMCIRDRRMCGWKPLCWARARAGARTFLT